MTTCRVCQQREPRTPCVCDADRSKLRSALLDLVDLVDELLAEPDELADHREQGDPVVALLPSQATSAQGKGGRVTGSKERPLPLSVDRLDLGWPARSVQNTDDDDQVGCVSVATVLDSWVRRIRAHRAKRERLPDTSVRALAEWLHPRVDEACDDFEHVKLLFDDVLQLRCQLRSTLGHVEIPDYKIGIPCRRCDNFTLVRVNGSDWIECGSCPELLSPEEYERWVGLVAVMYRRRQRTVSGLRKDAA